MSLLNENELAKVAMSIILHAGDARNDIDAALEYLKAEDFINTYKKLDEARDNIRKAHVVQTEVIQNETRGHAYQPSLLFTHAQDTLMTIHSEVRNACQLVKLFEHFVIKK